MKIKILLSAVLFVPILVFSQKLSEDFTITKSTPFGVVDAPSKDYIAGPHGKFTFSIKTRGEVVTVQKFDVDGMKEVSNNKYDDFPKYTKVQNVLNVKGRIYYVFEAYNKSEKTFSVYSREVDVAKGTFKEIKKQLTTSRPAVASGVTRIVPGGYWGVGSMPKFDIIPSFDSSRILVRYRLKPAVRSDANNLDEMGFYVFDSSFEKQWGAEVTMPHTEKVMDNLAYTVTSDGSAFMLSFINDSKAFELIKIVNGKLTNKPLAIKKGLYFTKFELRESANGNILSAGYYAQGTPEIKVDWSGTARAVMNINGLYAFEINHDGDVIKENDYPFSLDLIKQNLSDRQQEKAEEREVDDKAGILDLEMRNFIVNKDGSYVIIGEVNYVKKEFYMMSRDYVTHFGNLVATKINADGTVAWSIKMPKNQACLTKATPLVASLGITYLPGDGAHYILFTDNRKNAELQYDQPAEPHKGGFGGYLSSYKIDDATGKVEKHLLFDLTDIDGTQAYQFYTTRIFQAMDKKFLLEIYIKNKEDMIVKMELK